MGWWCVTLRESFVRAHALITGGVFVAHDVESVGRHGQRLQRSIKKL